MRNVVPLHTLRSRLYEDACDDRLNFIKEKRVILIVGPELLKVDTDSGSLLLYDWLAAKLNADTSRLPQPYSLNDVVCWHAAPHERREEAYTRLRSILREATFTPPIALKQFAAITDLDLFVSTAFDGNLAQDINEARFGGAQSTEVISYAPKSIVDLPTSREQMSRPAVYDLLSRVSASPTYVISDEDALEFVCALQSEN